MVNDLITHMISLKTSSDEIVAKLRENNKIPRDDPNRKLVRELVTEILGKDENLPKAFKETPSVTNAIKTCIINFFEQEVNRVEIR